MNDTNFYHDYGDDMEYSETPLRSESGCCMVAGIIVGLLVGILIGVIGT